MRILVAAVLILPLLARAAPDSITQHFMNQPASLFDLGMYRLEAFAHDSSEHMTTQYKQGAETDHKMTYG